MAMQPIDKSSSVPYYAQLAELLRREIGERQSPPESYQLPSENELAALHGITRATVRRALDVLERDGWIYREKGKGSFAAVRRVEHELTQLVSTTEDMQQRGWPLGTRVLSLDRLAPTTMMRNALELKQGQDVYRLERLRLTGDAPLSLQVSHLPQHLCPRLEENDLSQSLYRLLEGRYGLHLWTSKEKLRARGADRYEAHLLGVRSGSPVMSAERVTYAASGAPVEYLQAVWRGDRYDFTVVLSRPS